MKEICMNYEPLDRMSSAEMPVDGLQADGMMCDDEFR
jgi:hypothetical protein